MGIPTFGGKQQRRGQQRGREDTFGEVDGHAGEGRTRKPREGGSGSPSGMLRSSKIRTEE